MVFTNLCILVFWTKVASALEGLRVPMRFTGSTWFCRQEVWRAGDSQVSRIFNEQPSRHQSHHACSVSPGVIIQTKQDDSRETRLQPQRSSWYFAGSFCSQVRLDKEVSCCCGQGGGVVWSNRSVVYVQGVQDGMIVVSHSQSCHHRSSLS